MALTWFWHKVMQDLWMSSTAILLPDLSSHVVSQSVGSTLVTPSGQEVQKRAPWDATCLRSAVLIKTKQHFKGACVLQYTHAITNGRRGPAVVFVYSLSKTNRGAYASVPEPAAVSGAARLPLYYSRATRHELNSQKLLPWSSVILYYNMYESKPPWLAESHDRAWGWSLRGFAAPRVGWRSAKLKAWVVGSMLYPEVAVRVPVLGFLRPNIHMLQHGFGALVPYWYFSWRARCPHVTYFGLTAWRPWVSLYDQNNPYELSASKSAERTISGNRDLKYWVPGRVPQTSIPMVFVGSSCEALYRNCKKPSTMMVLVVNGMWSLLVLKFLDRVERAVGCWLHTRTRRPRCSHEIQKCALLYHPHPKTRPS